jgi:N-acetylmuramoyl-L-alanine amidase
VNFKPEIVFLDAGHGGIIPKGKGKGGYVTAPNKQYKHDKCCFHHYRYFYEGVFNRQIVNRVAEKLDALDIPYLIVSHEWRDTSLWKRVNVANWHHKTHKPGIFVSSHANAFRGDEYNVRGFEVHHFPKSNSGRMLAQNMLENVRELLGDQIKYRTYPIVKSNFYVLRKTWMPSILIEHSYFDNYEDALLLMDEEIQDRFAEAQVRTIVKAITNELDSEPPFPPGNGGSDEV